MIFLPNIKSLDKFKVIKSNAGSEESSEPSVTSLNNAASNARKSVGVSFFVAEKSLPTSVGGKEAIRSLVFQASSGIPGESSRPTDRLAVVNPSIGGARLGGAIRESQAQARLSPVASQVRPPTPESPVISQIISDRRSAGSISVNNPSQVSGSSPDGFSFDGINPGDGVPISSGAFAVGGEEFRGLTLSSTEKPGILATLASDIVDGYCTKNTLFIKKLTSERGFAQKYTILRKNAFIEDTFYPLIELSPASLPAPTNRQAILDSLSADSKNVFIYVDEDLIRDSVYIYKLALEWSTDPASKVESNLFTSAPSNIERLGRLGILFGR